MKKTVAVVSAVILAFGALTGCGGTRNVDIDKAKAKPVPGAKGLYYMCHTSTLIYFTSISGSSDEYDAYFSFHCAYDKASGEWYMLTDPGVPAEPKKSQEESEMNQQQERDK